jgi:hypothetical protein
MLPNLALAELVLNVRFPPVSAKSDPSAGETRGTASLPDRFRSQYLGRIALANHRIVAVGLLTEHDLRLLGDGFSRAWQIDETPCFAGLIEAIDEADRELWRERDRMAAEHSEI